MIRENDLVWSFHVMNYLMGHRPPAFDLLYWNSDSTRMPACMHSFYLRQMYIQNKLREPGGITVLGEPIDIRKIKVPVYFVSAIEDHIAPWKSTYLGAQLVSGPVRTFSAPVLTVPSAPVGGGGVGVVPVIGVRLPTGMLVRT